MQFLTSGPAPTIFALTNMPKPRASLKAPPPRVDRLFRAMSDPIRLRILYLLRKAALDAWSDGRRERCCGGEVCVCDLQRVIGAPQPTVSRHLAYLRRSGLVRQR